MGREVNLATAAARRRLEYGLSFRTRRVTVGRVELQVEVKLR